MKTVVIRECRRADRAGVAEVCCRTGFGGEGIGASGVFDDSKLFALLFSDYYVLHERGSCFVVVPEEEPERIVGYILGCPDTARFGRLFALTTLPRIALRALCVTSWRYPRTLRELLRWARNNPWSEANPAGAAYPAHLHIDLLPDYQRQGIGSELLERLESLFLSLGVPGIHLVTSSRHLKALPFYAKHGYRVLFEKHHRMWSGVEDFRSIVYVKKLAG